MKSIRWVVLACAGAAVLYAQAETQTHVRIERLPGPPPGMPEAFAMAGPAAGDVTFEFVAAEMNVEGSPVKGKPYSAEAVTETVQVLPDGNRITRRNTAALYRDSEGRTRREMNVAAIGPWAASGQPRQTVFIHDPVAGVSYVLDPQQRSARKMPAARMRRPAGAAVSGAAAAGEGGAVAAFRRRVEAPAGRPQPRIEPLGKQTIEGVEAEGTRTTFTIPAGQIGNEREIQIVTERWYSTDLHALVMSRRSDPRMGETTYKLTNLRRTEPLPSLFLPPADYTLREGPVMERRGVRKQGPDQ